jgi:hypothetical protein
VLKDANLSLTNTVADIGDWTDGINYKWSVATTGNVDVYFYYQPLPKKVSSLADLEKFDDNVEIITSKITSAITPPGPNTTYSAVTQLTINHQIISHATVWINLYRYQAYYDYIKATYPHYDENKIREISLTRGNGYVITITWHEFGHALFGLSDDFADDLYCNKGTMAYADMSFPYSVLETDTIKWEYSL